ncbi:MAG TPA: helix-turn-helix transcriptional regulator [Candidatus Coprenecus pullicola]|jgi:transcriptional regulator with XRE-family HTH domain|nr:helix-turn-helix transcriptional regulator [Candidatus Coprenecus pullicola]
MGLRIKELLKEKGMMHKELAEKLGVTDIALRASLKGNPTISTLEKVADALGVSVPELFAAPRNGVITCPHCGKSITIKTESE